MSSSQTYAEAVGEFLKQFRKDHGLTLDDVAKAGREFGASWGIASIRNIEAGKATASLPNLITLALALVELTGAEIRLHELLGNAESLTVPLLEGHPAKREWLDRVLSGSPVVIGYDDVVGGRLHKSERDTKDRLHIRAQYEELKRAPLPDWVTDLEIAQFMFTAPTLAEQRASRRLQIHPAVLLAWSQDLWGTRLEEEALSRAHEKAATQDTPPTPQARGAETRQLISEIQQAMEAHDDGSPA